MNRKNKLFLTVFLMGLIGIVIGTHLKINGNPNARYSLMGAMLLEGIGILGLVLHNWSKIKWLLK